MSKDTLGISLREFLGPMIDFFTKLLSSEGEVWWNGFKRFLRKENSWEHLINCDTDPFVPDSYQVEEHQKGGQFMWNPAHVLLYSSNNNTGNKIRKELSGKPVLNANVLDYLLANPHLIPEEWKGKHIFFWGTIYRDLDAHYLSVRGLYWSCGRWEWDTDLLDDHWFDGNHTALRAS